MAEGNVGPEAHAYSRPPSVEGEATNRAIIIADMAGAPLYVVHTSCEQAHEAIRRARQNGMRVYGEPLIQHLILDEGEYANPDWDHAARRVMSPPFRNRQHQDSLWAGLASGSLQCVATDHCAFTTDQKRFGLGDFRKIPNGTGGLEDRMPLLWTHGVATGRLTMNEFVAVTSTNIAKILNIYPRKGAILVGSDADIVVWDPALTKTISAANHQSAIDYNVFEGQKVKGLPRYTLARAGERRGRHHRDTGRPRPVHRPRSLSGRQPGAFHLEGARIATQGGTHGHSGIGRVIMSEPKREILIAAAILLNEKRQMLVVRKRGTTQFMQPGGKIDPGETPEQALHRELAEEIGLTLPENAARYEGIFREEAANEPGADVVAHAFTARLHSEVTPQAEIEEVRWLDLDRTPASPSPD